MVQNLSVKPGRIAFQFKINSLTIFKIFGMVH
jgi:hypothetical protein